MNSIEKIKKQISDNMIVLYIKGPLNSSKCKFSAQAVKILLPYSTYIKYIDVLEHKDIRNSLPAFSNWPTFPQLWINKKLIGGCDTIMKMNKNGELRKILLSIIKK
ncbi:MAG: Grx4 family monothiol glutaredoxin [Enterobacterales bacterium]